MKPKKTVVLFSSLGNKIQSQQAKTPMKSRASMIRFNKSVSSCNSSYISPSPQASPKRTNISRFPADLTLTKTSFKKEPNWRPKISSFSSPKTFQKITSKKNKNRFINSHQESLQVSLDENFQNILQKEDREAFYNQVTPCRDMDRLMETMNTNISWKKKTVKKGEGLVSLPRPSARPCVQPPCSLPPSPVAYSPFTLCPAKSPLPSQPSNKPPCLPSLSQTDKTRLRDILARERHIQADTQQGAGKNTYRQTDIRMAILMRTAQKVREGEREREGPSIQRSKFMRAFRLWEQEEGDKRGHPHRGVGLIKGHPQGSNTHPPLEQISEGSVCQLGKKDSWKRIYSPVLKAEDKIGYSSEDLQKKKSSDFENDDKREHLDLSDTPIVPLIKVPLTKAQEEELKQKKNLRKKRWQKLHDFLFYVVRQQISHLLPLVSNYSFFTENYGLPNSKEAFLMVKTTNANPKDLIQNELNLANGDHLSSDNPFLFEINPESSQAVCRLEQILSADPLLGYTRDAVGHVD